MYNENFDSQRQPIRQNSNSSLISNNSTNQDLNDKIGRRLLLLDSPERGNSFSKSDCFEPLKVTIIRVFIAYDCGLESGTSVRLKVTEETTAREVVVLVIEQISKVRVIF